MSARPLTSFLVGVALVLTIGPASATSEALYIAVPDGSKPGIYKAIDRNGDLDALDTGEVTLFAVSPNGGFTDVAASGTGIVFAIEAGSANVYRMEDRNDDGDALDPGETTVFRSDQAGVAQGALLLRPVGLAVTTFFDPFQNKARVQVYTMDVVIQKALQLEDLDGDGDANDASELRIVDTFTQQGFTPEKMVVDKAGRVVAVNANLVALVRLDDANGDFSISNERNECPAVTNGCGPGPVTDFRIIRDPSGLGRGLRGPYGVTMSMLTPDWFVSDPGSGLVYRLTDVDLDEDAQSANEIAIYAELGQMFDLTSDRRDVLYVSRGGGPKNIVRLEDVDGSGDVLDPGEVTDFAEVPGTAVAVDLLIPFEPRSLVIKPLDGLENSPLKGPLLLVEGIGNPAKFRLQIFDDDTGDPVPLLRMANTVLQGCFSICSTPTHQTDSDGIIGYEVERTAASDGQETLKFWTEDGSGGVLGQNDNVLVLPVIQDPCTPDPPVANAGPDKVLTDPPPPTALLSGSASVGQGLRYCWTQTGGTSVGLPECGDEKVDIAFNLPVPLQSTLTFKLEVRNACDVFSAPDEVQLIHSCGPDSDGDGIGDSCDNCTLVANPDQRDTNGDGFGNICDPDLNNDNMVNFVDLGIMKSVFFSADPDADLDGNGSVNFIDLGIMKNLFFGPPGPSGTAP